MRKAKIVKLKENNMYIKGRGLPKGCKLCLKGQKTVLFISGICQKPGHCYWYCPISTERRNNNLTYANEIQITSKKGLLEEVNNTNAKGMSVTGGEPLSELNLEKTLDYIKYIKIQKGNKFHVHLYTNGINVNNSIAGKLALAGLDEIRFHPPIENWANIEFALNRGMAVGAEFPVIPNKENIEELQNLIIYLNSIGANFVNLNEFEFCFPNSESLKNRGYQLKKDSIASVVNSYEFAIDLMKDLIDIVSIKVHFCPIRSKDYYQLKYRYMRRAKNVKLPFEAITEEGLLMFAQIEGNKNAIEKFRNILLSEMNINMNLILFNGKELRLPLYLSIDNQIVSLFEKFQLKGYIVEMTPFRQQKYQQITEKTPIKLFKEEFGLNES
ncbi:MAG: 4Fe-4S cluster-binding domain-containing protein [Candidatus Thorarchaeota archaeon]